MVLLIINFNWCSKFNGKEGDFHHPKDPVDVYVDATHRCSSSPGIFHPYPTRRIINKVEFYQLYSFPSSGNIILEKF